MSPKISAPTIQQQRLLRQDQIIQTALSMALETGAESITMSAVAKAAGISRSSIYEYFSSSADLISDLVIEELQCYRERLLTATEGSDDPLDQISLWIEAALGYVIDGRHILVKSLNSITPPDYRKDEIRSGHRALLETISAPLRALGIPMDSPALSLLQSAIDVATRRIETGSDVQSELTDAQTYAVAGIGALSESFKRAGTRQI